MPSSLTSENFITFLQSEYGSSEEAAHASSVGEIVTRSIFVPVFVVASVSLVRTVSLKAIGEAVGEAPAARVIFAGETVRNAVGPTLGLEV